MIKLRALFAYCCASADNQGSGTITIKNDNRNGSKKTPHVAGQLEYDSDSNQGANKKSKPFKITAEEVALAPELILTVADGNVLPLLSEIVINAAGIAKGGRNKRQGIVYVGSQKYKLSTKTSQQKLMNDLLLNDPTVGMRHCMFKYDTVLKNYWLKDLGEGSGTFIKIETEMKVKSGYIISFSDSHLLITISDGSLDNKTMFEGQEAPEKDTLILKFLNGPKMDQVFTFPKEEKVIKIGRMNDCGIKFDGNTLSRYQSSFEYRDGAWYASDGFGEKTSTNGTWLFLGDFFEVKGGTLIKIGQTLFRTALKTRE